MKLVKIIIQHIVIPLATALFIIVVGLGSGGISAVIEYSVFREMFTSDYLQLIPARSIAVLLVVILEFSKIYLHFLHEKVDCNSKFRQRTKYILPFLVMISTVCTIIFGVTTLHLATYDKDSINAKIEEIDTKLNQNIIDVTAYYDNAYNNALKQYETAKSKAESDLSTFNPEGLTRSERDIKLNSLKIAVQIANNEYNAACSSLYEKFEGQKTEAIDSLKKEADLKKEQLLNVNSPEIASKYNNPIIAHFLTVLAQILFNAPTYSQSVYLLFTVLFSIIVAVVLEAIISLCFKFISYPLETLVENTASITPTLQVWCNNLILTSLKTCCALFISLIIITSTPVNTDNFQFASAALSCGVAIMLVRHFVSSKTAVSERSEQFIYAIRDSLLEGIVSFMGYVLLGFVLGEGSINLDVSTMAIGIGASLASFFGYAPQYLVNKINSVSTT